MKAREHPYKAVRPTRKGDFMQFQYRIYCRDWQNVVSEAPVEHIQGAYIWESVTLFNSTEDVRVALDGHFLKVVVLSQNYQTAQESDCGRFLVELVDSQSIIAYYPAAFPSRQAAQKGAERMLHAVNVEGFHLIEHILLRPQEKNQADTILLNLDPTLTTLWDDTFIDEADKSSDKLTKAAVYKTFVTNNLPGKDPYSAQLTVFLPYWSKRFQNERFRDFFENTLQREVPAHCLLRTVWLTPEDMCRFEMQYRTWLEALSNGEDEPEKKALIQQIAAQASVFDDAILSGSSKNYGVHLDKIQLVDAPKLKI